MKVYFPTWFSNLSVSPFLLNTDSFTANDAVSDELEGLRLAVKDVFHMKGLATTAGNPDWQKTHAIPDATHSNVGKLLGAGAKFVGKTITDELAYSLNGQNTHYGTPTNYASPSRLPGGSSSGSAAAVAGGFADIGLGTDTGGSIRVPASYNGFDHLTV
jgi:Asp-tRNA(Asn)/Glu-tRNA(Gln) amidotransferase A subunit family amidase